MGAACGVSSPIFVRNLHFLESTKDISIKIFTYGASLPALIIDPLTGLLMVARQAKSMSTFEKHRRLSTSFI